MVLRRCHLIVVSDAGTDPDFVFEDLGNAIRKVRVDLVHLHAAFCASGGNSSQP